MKFFHKDQLSSVDRKRFDFLLAIDVFEHVTDCMAFLAKFRQFAAYKMYHILLDIHVSSVLMGSLTANRYSTGHIRYFTAESALDALKDTGHEVVDYFYTSGAIDIFKKHPSFKTALANLPRWAFYRFSAPFAARFFGGYSLLTLSK